MSLKQPSAVAYYRCSTESQDASIRLQRQAVERWAPGLYEIVAARGDEGSPGSKHSLKRFRVSQVLAGLNDGRHPIPS